MVFFSFFLKILNLCRGMDVRIIVRILLAPTIPVNAGKNKRVKSIIFETIEVSFDPILAFIVQKLLYKDAVLFETVSTLSNHPLISPY